MEYIELAKTILRFQNQTNCDNKTAEDCNKCPIHIICECADCYTANKDGNMTEFLSEIAYINNWKADHPAKTKQDALMENYPNIDTFNYNGLRVCTICPNSLDTNGVQCHYTCAECKADYWLSEVDY